MSILSMEFLLFLSGLMIVYYIAPVRLRWMVLLAASLIFYAFSGWRGTAYLLCVAGITYGGALGEAKLRRKAAQQSAEQAAVNIRQAQRWLLAGCLLLCFGALAFCKLAAAVLEAVGTLFTAAAGEGSLPELDVFIPLGLSYFTFQSAGYLIDVYREKFEPERNPAKYLLFVSFFPQMTQGPISTWPQLAPQLVRPRRFAPDRFAAGAQLLLWGYFKKLVIADRLAPVVSSITEGGQAQAGWLIGFGAIAFAVRLYADFSGGMDVIRGAAYMLGIDMVENFKRPFFASSVAEYWRRWHITLGVWFRSYLFYPLTVSRAGLFCGRLGQRIFGKKIGYGVPGALATVVIFLGIGLWHTASWSAVAYGLYFGVVLGLAMLLEPVFKRIRRGLRIRKQSAFWKTFRVLRTLLLVIVAQYFAMAAAPREAFAMLQTTAFHWQFTSFSQMGAQLTALLSPLEWGILGAALMLLLAMDFICERGVDVKTRIAQAPLYVRWPLVILLILLIVIFGCYGQGFDQTAFLYMQF